MEELKDKFLVCKDCRRKFVFTVRDQKKFGQKGWEDPIRCRVCRRMKSIRQLALEERMPISAEIKFSEVCDKCDRKFYTNVKRRDGVNLYCDDCWEEIKRGDVKKDRKEGQGVAEGKT